MLNRRNCRLGIDRVEVKGTFAASSYAVTGPISVLGWLSSSRKRSNSNGTEMVLRQTGFEY